VKGVQIKSELHAQDIALNGGTPDVMNNGERRFSLARFAAMNKT
jgi:hypothetical protein